MGLWTKGESLLLGVADGSSSFQCTYDYHIEEGAYQQGYSCWGASGLLHLQHDGYTVCPPLHSQLMVGMM
jgi:hypothetical protein